MTYTTYETASEAYSLGDQVAEYKPKGGRVILLIIGFIFASASVFAILYALKGSNVDSGDRIPIALLAAFGLLIGWLLIENWIGKRGYIVKVFTDGLVQTRYGKTVVVRWDEIVGVWQAITKHYTNGIYTRTTHVYTVQQADNTKAVFNDALKNVEALGNTIQQQVTTRLLPRAITQYNNGGTVQFGKLAISPAGLSWGDKSLPWSDIEAVQIQKGYLSVKKQGKWFKWANIPVASIPNMIVALSLVDRIVGVKTEK